MECQGKSKFNLKQFMKMWIFLIGFGILVWQSQSTFATFFSYRTTVAISKETNKNLPPPTIVLCQEHKWINGFVPWKNNVNMSDKDWVFKQFYRLNEKMNINIFGEELMIGNNSFSLNEYGQSSFGGSDMILMVKELLNPWTGLCYAIIPDPSTTPMKQTSYYAIQIKLSEEIKNPHLFAYLISSEDWHGFVLGFIGDLKPFKVSLAELQTIVGIKIEERKYFHLRDSFYLPSSMTNCKDYSTEEDSYMKCRVKSYVDNFDDLAIDSGCTCIPTLYKSYFEIQPSSLGFEECKTNSEWANCISLIGKLDELDHLASKCPQPCKKADYNGQLLGLNGGYWFMMNNEIEMQIKFNTMDTEIHNNVLTFDLATFIGTAGGSLGLFLGFSLTGFSEQILNFFMRN